MAYSKGQYVQVAAMVEPERADYLEQIAKERGVSRSDVVRDFLRRGQADWETEQRIVARTRELMAATEELTAA